MLAYLKQRRLQFTVTNALLLTTIIAITVAWRLDHSRLTAHLRANANHHRSLSALARLGTRITFDANGNPTSVHFNRTHTDDDVAHLLYLPSVREVNLAYCYSISDKAIEHLTQLPNLEVLYLYRNSKPFTKQPGKVTDKSLETIGRIQSLKELYLWDNHFTDDGILKLRSLPNLEKLRFRSPRISGDALAALQRSLPNTHIYDDR